MTHLYLHIGRLDHCRQEHLRLVALPALVEDGEVACLFPVYCFFCSSFSIGVAVAKLVICRFTEFGAENHLPS